MNAFVVVALALGGVDRTSKPTIGELSEILSNASVTFRFREREAKDPSVGGRTLDGMMSIGYVPGGFWQRRVYTEYLDATTLVTNFREQTSYYSCTTGESVSCYNMLGGIGHQVYISYWVDLPSIFYLAAGYSSDSVPEGGTATWEELGAHGRLLEKWPDQELHTITETIEGRISKKHLWLHDEILGMLSLEGWTSKLGEPEGPNTILAADGMKDGRIRINVFERVECDPLQQKGIPSGAAVFDFRTGGKQTARITDRELTTADLLTWYPVSDPVDVVDEEFALPKSAPRSDKLSSGGLILCSCLMALGLLALWYRRRDKMLRNGLAAMVMIPGGNQENALGKFYQNALHALQVQERIVAQVRCSSQDGEHAIMERYELPGFITVSYQARIQEGGRHFLFTSLMPPNETPSTSCKTCGQVCIQGASTPGVTHLRQRVHFKEACATFLAQEGHSTAHASIEVRYDSLASTAKYPSIIQTTDGCDVVLDATLPLPLSSEFAPVGFEWDLHNPSLPESSSLLLLTDDGERAAIPLRLEWRGRPFALSSPTVRFAREGSVEYLSVTSERAALERVVFSDDLDCIAVQRTKSSGNVHEWMISESALASTRHRCGDAVVLIYVRSDSRPFERHVKIAHTRRIVTDRQLPLLEGRFYPGERVLLLESPGGDLRFSCPSRFPDGWDVSGVSDMTPVGQWDVPLSGSGLRLMSGEQNAYAVSGSISNGNSPLDKWLIHRLQQSQ